MSTDDETSCAGAIDEDVLFRYLRTGPARLCWAHSAIKANVCSDGMVI